MLKSTGIVRKLDELGRIVLPAELRRTMALPEGAAVEIFTEGDMVLLRPYQPLCVFCGSGGNTVRHCGKQVCESCRTAIADESAHSTTLKEVVHRGQASGL